MRSKPFGAGAHCAIDYAFVTTLLLGPRLLGLPGRARAISYAFGTAAGLLTAATDQPFALRRAIPLHTHGQADTPFVPILLLLPWAAGALRERTARRFFVAFFAAALTNFLLTDYDAPASSILARDAG